MKKLLTINAMLLLLLLCGDSAACATSPATTSTPGIGISQAVYTETADSIDFNSQEISDSNKVWNIRFNRAVDYRLFQVNGWISLMDVTSHTAVKANLLAGTTATSIAIAPPAGGYLYGHSYQIIIVREAMANDNISLRKRVQMGFTVKTPDGGGSSGPVQKSGTWSAASSYDGAVTSDFSLTVSGLAGAGYYQLLTTDGVIIGPIQPLTEKTRSVGIIFSRPDLLLVKIYSSSTDNTPLASARLSGASAGMLIFE